jgi:hypothetical protein
VAINLTPHFVCSVSQSSGTDPPSGCIEKTDETQ